MMPRFKKKKKSEDKDRDSFEDQQSSKRFFTLGKKSKSKSSVASSEGSLNNLSKDKFSSSSPNMNESLETDALNKTSLSSGGHIASNELSVHVNNTNGSSFNTVNNQLASDLDSLQTMKGEEVLTAEASHITGIPFKEGDTGSGSGYRDKALEAWKGTDVFQWLKENDLAYYAELFDGHEIDGNYLKQLSENDLLDLDVKDPQLREKLRNAVSEFVKESLSNSINRVDESYNEVNGSTQSVTLHFAAIENHDQGVGPKKAAKLPESRDCQQDTTDESALTRVTNLPIVTSTLTKVSEVYNWTKDASSMVKYSLEIAERSVAAAASSAQPVVDYLEKPITYANNIANQQLDKLEETVPLITEPSEKFLSTLQEGAWDAVEKTKTMGTQRMNNLMRTGVGQVMTVTVKVAMDLSEKALDYYLPEINGVSDGKDNSEEDTAEIPRMELEAPMKYKDDQPFTNTVQKASQLSNKILKRLYQKTLINVQYAQERSLETLGKLHFIVDLIANFKASIESASPIVRQRMRKMQERLWSTWDSWTTDETSGSEGCEGDEDVTSKELLKISKDAESSEPSSSGTPNTSATPTVRTNSGEAKTLAIARNLARRLRVLTTNIASSLRILPQSLLEGLEEARNFVEVLYHSFDEVQSFKDLPSSAMTTAKYQLNRLQATTIAIADYLFTSYAMKFLVPAGIRA